MASQEEKDKKAELIAEAVALGINKQGLHMCGIETLEAKILDAKTEKPIVREADVLPDEPEVSVEQKAKEEVRKVAPRMSVAGLNTNARTEEINRLEKENPGYKYMFQNSNITAGQLAAKGLESTGKHLKNDLICRTEFDSYHEVNEAKNEANRRLMDSIDTEGQSIKSYTSQRKKAG